MTRADIYVFCKEHQKDVFQALAEKLADGAEAHVARLNVWERLISSFAEANEGCTPEEIKKRANRFFVRYHAAVDVFGEHPSSFRDCVDVTTFDFDGYYYADEVTLRRLKRLEDVFETGDITVVGGSISGEPCTYIMCRGVRLGREEGGGHEDDRAGA